MPNFSANRTGTTARGYGHDHMRSRRNAFAALPEWSPCVRCHQPMWKHATEPYGQHGRTRSAIHYDHNGTRSGYLGFSHAQCNQSAGAAEGGRRRHTVAIKQPSRHSRPW